MKKISDSTISRLSKYYRTSGRLIEKSVKTVSSDEIAEIDGVTSAQRYPSSCCHSRAPVPPHPEMPKQTADVATRASAFGRVIDPGAFDWTVEEWAAPSLRGNLALRIGMFVPRGISLVPKAVV